jgi:hypothetical protein
VALFEVPVSISLDGLTYRFVASGAQVVLPFNEPGRVLYLKMSPAVMQRCYPHPVPLAPTCDLALRDCSCFRLEVAGNSNSSALPIVYRRGRVVAFYLRPGITGQVVVTFAARRTYDYAMWATSAAVQHAAQRLHLLPAAAALFRLHYSAAICAAAPSVLQFGCELYTVLHIVRATRPPARPYGPVTGALAGDVLAALSGVGLVVAALLLYIRHSHRRLSEQDRKTR